MQEWASIIRIKLPLLFLPLAFASPLFYFKARQWKAVFLFLLVLVTVTSLWSVAGYLVNMPAIHQGYLKAQTLQTPLENDHVRYSWMVSVTVLIGALFFARYNFLKWQKIVLAFVITWLIVYLHILAARTGVLCFYSMLMIGAVWIFWKHKINAKSFLLLTAIIVLPLIAWFTLPTFQNRVHYFLYDFSYFKNAQYLPGSNDGVRIISIKAGWHILNEAPLTGVGFGDIKAETGKWYTASYPQMLQTDKIYPCSEPMMYAAGAGWIGLVLFLMAVSIPFFLTKYKSSLGWILINLTAIISFMFDIGLEVQLGVFLYAFIILWFYTGLRYGLLKQEIEKNKN